MSAPKRPMEEVRPGTGREAGLGHGFTASLRRKYPCRRESIGTDLKNPIIKNGFRIMLRISGMTVELIFGMTVGAIFGMTCELSSLRTADCQ